MDLFFKVFSMFFIVTVGMVFASIFRRWRGRTFPPGPKGLPFIGNMLMMDKLTHRGLAALSKQYGGIFHLKMGFLHVVVVSDPDVTRNVLQVQDIIFSNRPTSTAIKYLTYNRADLVFANYGSFWRQIRKLFVINLFSRSHADSWTSIGDEITLLIQKIAAATAAVNIGDLLFETTMNITYRAAFGTNERQDQREFISILQDFSKLFAAFNIADFVPFLGWIDPQGLGRRLAGARGALDLFIDRIIDDHLEKKKKKEEESVDMVDELLEFYGEEGKGSEKVVRLTRDNIKAIIMDVMFGGIETIASTIEWALSELLRNPDELKKVQEELGDVVGLDRQVEETDLENLTYLKCVLKETLRLHPPIPLLLHETAEDAKLAGFFIPAKWRVMVNVWAIGRDESSWDDAGSFRPVRFLKEGAADFKGSDFQFIPFGSGRRSCPGMQLGMYATEMAMARVLHCFTWELPGGMNPSELDMDDVFGLTAPRASRLVVVPVKRVVCSLV